MTEENRDSATVTTESGASCSVKNTNLLYTEKSSTESPGAILSLAGVASLNQTSIGALAPGVIYSYAEGPEQKTGRLTEGDRQATALNSLAEVVWQRDFPNSKNALRVASETLARMGIACTDAIGKTTVPAFTTHDIRNIGAASKTK